MPAPASKEVKHDLAIRPIFVSVRLIPRLDDVWRSQAAVLPDCQRSGSNSWMRLADANASANLYSLLQTCRVNGIDSYRYLRTLLIELPRAKTVDDFEALLPWRLSTAER